MENEIKHIDCKAVKAAAVKLIKKCLTTPDPDVTAYLDSVTDDAPLAVAAAKLIVENNRIAEKTSCYACQDTGQAVFIVKLGDRVSCPGLYDALVSATVEAYAEARKSVADPLTRLNTGDNTPPIIDVELTSGDTLTIAFLAKGAGSENMARLYMLKPSDGEDGIIDAAVDAVKRGGRNACPPLIVGIGIGGVTETACMLSKKALLRPIAKPSPREDVRRLEEVILDKINALGIGIAALGGKNTALSVAIETAPTHIGMLPVAVNLQCHSARHGVIEF